MDPASKRLVWNILCKVRDSGKSIILTTHNMDECEAICTKLAIMVNGTFKCLGSTQHLKSKFSDGYTLTIKTKRVADKETLDENVNSINAFVLKNFPSAVLKEQHEEMLSYLIKEKSMPWSSMFGIMETGRKRLSIEDYSLGQCSLEQVNRIYVAFEKPDFIINHSLFCRCFFCSQDSSENNTRYVFV